MTIIVNCNESNALERSVINYWGPKSILHDHNPGPGFLCCS